MIEFHHAPRSRSSSILWLIEELAVSYEMTVVDIRAPGGVRESYRAIQPNKKVAAVTDDGVTVTERGAICIRLADKYPEAGLAPAIGDPMRGPISPGSSIAIPYWTPRLRRAPTDCRTSAATIRSAPSTTWSTTSRGA